MSIVYDAGVLLAAERGDREIWADHRARLELGVVPWTTAPVVAQASRSPRQAQLRRLLRGCHVEAFTSEHAHEVGALLGKAGTANVVDAHVIIAAASTAATALTSDPDDLRHLSHRLPTPVPVRRVR
jgi:hypothetical protein